MKTAVVSQPNEITAIPVPLKLLEFRSTWVTIDAMGCQREIAATIVAEGKERDCNSANVFTLEAPMFRTAVCLLALVLIDGRAFGDLSYTLTPIGPAGAQSSSGVALNNSGQATGTFTLDGLITESFFWNGVSVSVIPSSGGNTIAKDISPSGEVVGRATNRPFRYDTTNGMSLIGPSEGEATGTNANGEVIGNRNLGNANRTNVWSPSNVVTSPANSKGSATILIIGNT